MSSMMLHPEPANSIHRASRIFLNGQRIIKNFIKANPDYNDYKITFEYKENSKDEKN